MIESGALFSSRSPSDDTRLTLSHGGAFRLAFFRDDPDGRLAEALHASRIRLGLVDAGVHTLVLLHEIDGVTCGWDAVDFSFGAWPCDYEPLVEGEGFLFDFVLCERGTDRVIAHRRASVTPAFSQTLDRLLLRQIRCLEGYSEGLRQDELALLRARHASESDMLADALALEAVGLPFIVTPDREGRLWS